MHQTKTFTMYLIGAIFDMEPKEIKRPKGSANKSVSENIRNVI